ncbi:hypothetical protein A3D05_03910 [Candidatus Gottesmanbacteria bacterium RIFCSPHIGHO2_02_FULL_40_24]|nr:MAG: hypothetical protein A3D05_03910 [Candidatus Gottesmanbacteria bacterium RIFCSPHIGHO2_02_FULL_40_24]
MRFNDLWLILLFFIPVIESFSRQWGLFFLFSGVFLFTYPFLWRGKIRLDILDFLFLVFIILALFSGLFSISQSRSFIELGRYVAYLLLFITIREKDELRRRLSGYITASIILNAFLLSFVYSVYLILGKFLPPVTSGMNLFFPVFGHNKMTVILIMAIPLLIELIFYTPLRRKKIFFILLLIIFSILLIISLSRGAVWSLAVSLGIYFLLVRRSHSGIAKILTVYITAAVALFLTIFIFSNFIIPGKKGAALYSGIYKPAVNEKRGAYWQQAVKGFTLSPVIGSGLDTFRYISKKYQTQTASWSWYTHNHFLQLFAELGFFGGFIFLIFIISMFFASYRTINKIKTIDPVNRGLLIALTASAIHSLIDFDWQFVSVLFFVFAGFASVLPKEEESAYVNPRLIYLTAAVIIGFNLIITRDSDKVLTEADKLARNGQYEKAEIKLIRAVNLDEGYNELHKKLASYYVQSGNYPAAHYWYYRSISANPLDSGEEIKTDYLLYLQEAGEALVSGQKETVSEIISKGERYYPVFHEKYGKETPGKNDLDYYVKIMKRLVSENHLRSWELKKYFGNLR